MHGGSSGGGDAAGPAKGKNTTRNDRTSAVVLCMSVVANGAAAELRAEGPSVLAACSAGADDRTRGVLRRGPVQPGACARLNVKREPRCFSAGGSTLLFGLGITPHFDFNG